MRKEVIGNATLYLGDMLAILPHEPSSNSKGRRVKIEFRWQPIPSVWEGDAYVRVGYHKEACVLQFRYVTERRDYDSDIKFQGWTEWEDVQMGSTSTRTKP